MVSLTSVVVKQSGVRVQGVLLFESFGSSCLGLEFKV